MEFNKAKANVAGGTKCSQRQRQSLLTTGKRTTPMEVQSFCKSNTFGKAQRQQRIHSTLQRSLSLLVVGSFAGQSPTKSQTIHTSSPGATLSTDAAAQKVKANPAGGTQRKYKGIEGISLGCRKQQKIHIPSNSKHFVNPSVSTSFCAVFYFAFGVPSVFTAFCRVMYRVNVHFRLFVVLPTTSIQNAMS